MKIKISKKKQMTIDSLAIMVSNGFNNVISNMALKSETATKTDIEKLDKKIDLVKTELKGEIHSLRNSVNNYLKLTDKRYLELKNNQKILAKYLKAVIKKSKIPVNLKELETVLK